MKGKKTKIVLSLLIALAFILPTANIYADDTTKVIDDAGVQKVIENKNIAPMRASNVETAVKGIAPLGGYGGLWEVEVSEIKVPPIISEGTYPIVAEFCRPDFFEGMTPYYTLAYDTVAEDTTATHVAYCDVMYQMTGHAPPVAFIVSAAGRYGVQFGLWVQSKDQNTIRAWVNNPMDIGGNWINPGSFVQILRDYNMDNCPDWGVRYYQDDSWSYYDGTSWGGVVPHDHGYNAVTKTMWVEFGGGAPPSLGQFGGWMKEVGWTNDFYVSVPCDANFDAPNDYMLAYTCDPNVEDYLDVPEYQDLPVNISGAADCDYVYLRFNSTGGETISKITLDFLGDPTPWVFDTNIPDEVSGIGTHVVDIKIAKSLLPMGDCNTDPLGFDYEVRHFGSYSLRNSGCVEPVDMFNFDCGTAEIKKFMEIYKQNITEGDPDVIEEIYCTDFEEPCDIYDEWATFDMYPNWGTNGAIDTWTWSDKRSNSPDHSFHSTSFDTYLGNQYDILELNMDGAGVDVSAYTDVTLTFSHWMEGDAIVVNGSTIIQDGGFVEYSFDGSYTDLTSNIVPGSSVYYDNDWTDESFTIDTTGESTLFIRFVFFSDPSFCYEGWYIDDVCLEGLIPGSEDIINWDFVHDSHSWEQTMEGECLEHTFLDEWDATEGIYKICVWMQILDDCHYTNDTSDNQFCIIVEVADIVCIEDAALYVTPESPAWEGTDLHIFSDVQNLGTIPAEDVQVKVTVKRGSISIVFEDDVESGPYGSDVYHQYRFGGTNPDKDFWHITTDDASSGTHSWAYYDPVTKKYPNEVNAPPQEDQTYGANLAVGLTGSALGVNDYTLNPTLTFKAKWVFDYSGWADYWTIGIYDNSTGYTWSSYPSVPPYPGAYENIHTGVQDTWTEMVFDFTDLLTSMQPYVGDTYFNGDDLRPAFLIYTDDAVNEVAPYTWSGLMLDDFEIRKMQEGEEIIWTETQEIDIINASTFWTPGETKTAEFIWENAGVGNYIIKEEVLGEIGDCNGMLMMGYKVINYQEELDDWEFIDLTAGGPCYWIVDDCCGGSFWVGDPETTMYGNNWDQLLYIAPGGEKTNAGFGGTTLEFKTFFQINASDYGSVEVSEDGGLHWTQLTTYTGKTTGFGEDQWHDTSVAIPANVDQIRFRFVSNETVTNRGWMIDDVYIAGIIDDPCEDFTNFICEEMSYGNWWASPDQYHAAGLDWYSSGQADYEETWWWWEGGPDIIPDYANVIEDPTDTFGCYDISKFSFTPGTEWYPKNIENAAQTTINFEDHVFFAWYQAGTVADFGSGDTLVTQYSNDGGVTWQTYQSLAGLGALRADYIEFQDELAEGEILLRYVVTSDDVEDGFRPGWWPPWRPSIAFGATFVEPMIYGMKDLNAPVTTITMEGTFDETYHYYTSDVAIYLDATDDVTGVAATYYILDGVEYEYQRPFVIEDDGEHTLCFYSVDNEGNVETQQCVVPFRIDQSGPDVTITGPEPGIYLMGNKVLNSDKYIFLFGGVTISASVSVDDAPLSSVEFYMNDELFGEDTSAPFSLKCTLKNSGAATFKVIARDVLGESDQDELTVDTYLKLF